MKSHPIISREHPYEDACKHLGMEAKTLNDFSFLPENQRQYMYSQHRVVTVLDVAKEGDDAMDWNDDDQYKYSPWWDMETYGDAPTGSGFAFYVCGFGHSLTDVGSRLSSLSRETTTYVAEVMIEDYRVLMKG